MWDRPSVTTHTILSKETMTYVDGNGFQGRIFQRTPANPKPVYSSCLVPYHRPQFEPVCTGINLTGTPFAVIINLAPLVSPTCSFFIHHPLAAFIIKRLMFNLSRSRTDLALGAQTEKKHAVTVSFVRANLWQDFFCSHVVLYTVFISMFLRRQGAQTQNDSGLSSKS